MIKEFFLKCLSQKDNGHRMNFGINDYSSVAKTYRILRKEVGLLRDQAKKLTHEIYDCPLLDGAYTETAFNLLMNDIREDKMSGNTAYEYLSNNLSEKASNLFFKNLLESELNSTG